MKLGFKCNNSSSCDIVEVEVAAAVVAVKVAPAAVAIVTVITYIRSVIHIFCRFGYLSYSKMLEVLECFSLPSVI